MLMTGHAARADEPLGLFDKEPSRCRLKRSEVSKYATSMLNAYKSRNEDFDGGIPIAPIRARYSSEPNHPERDVYAEGFVRPAPGFYRFVPGLGLGVEIKKDTLLYVCLDMRKPGHRNKLIVHFLKAKHMDRSRVELSAPKAELTTSNVSARPLTEGVHFIRELPLIGALVPNFLEKGTTMFNASVNKALGVVASVGVQGLEVTPTEVHFQSDAEIGSITAIENFGTTIKMASPWLVTPEERAKLVEEDDDKLFRDAH